MTLFLAANILVGIFYIILGLIGHFRGQGSRSNNIFFGLSICMSGLTFSNAFMNASDTASDAWIWHLTGMFFWAVVYPLMLWVVLELATDHKLSPKKAIAGIAAIAVAVVALSALPEFGGGVRLVKTSLGWARDFTGMGYWPWAGIAYSMTSFGFILTLLFRWYKKTGRAGEKRQAMWLLVTGLIALAVAAYNIKVINPAGDVPSKPWTPHFLGLFWAVGFVVGMWKFKLMPGMPSMAMKEVLSAIQDGIVFLNSDGVITEANLRVKTILGVDPARLIGRQIVDIKEFKPVMSIISGDSPRFDTELNVFNSDGVQIPVNVVATRVKDDHGQFKGTVVVVQDLRSTRELVEAKRLESLAIMSAGIAHDFNNLLTVAGGYLELCLKGLDREKAARQRGYLIEASFALAQARSLTGQLMTFSRGGDPVRRNVSLERLVEESAGLVLAGTSVALLKETESGLWPVCVDPVQTGQVFNNLLLNAVQAMPSGGTIIIRQANLPGQNGCPDMVRVEIEDTGCGIPESIIHRVFDPFFTARKGGTGLGLASVKSIINRHGGRISVESSVGQGSLFTVDLPRGSAPDFGQTVLVNAVSASNGRVLVMDDIESVRRVAVEMLCAIGYDADSVEDGDEAVRVIKIKSDEGMPYDIVILDVTVPGGTGGIAALSSIKRVQPNIGTVVSSGYSAGSELADFKNCGFDSALPKPYTLENLAAAVSCAMDLHKSRITGRNRTISQWVKRDRIQKAEGPDAVDGIDRCDPS